MGLFNSKSSNNNEYTKTNRVNDIYVRPSKRHRRNNPDIDTQQPTCSDSSRKRRKSHVTTAHVDHPHSKKGCSRRTYETLFLTGHNSDISIRFQNKSWHLHKRYLVRCRYFQAMLSGNWAESNAKEIELQFDKVDSRVSCQSIEICLGYLYHPNIDVDLDSLVSVFATSLVLFIEELTNKCMSSLLNSINVQNVISYLSLSEDYPTHASILHDNCIQFLNVNLLMSVSKHANVLFSIPIHVMTELITSPRLFVIQSDLAIYLLLRFWMYLKVQYISTRSDLILRNSQFLVTDSQTFFKSSFEKNGSLCFLETENGSAYVETFRRIRLSNIAFYMEDLKMVEGDKIIPECWLNPIYRSNWLSILRIDHTEESSMPLSNFLISQVDFESNCFRFGRILPNRGATYVWRWTSFMLGLDLIFTFENDCLLLKRNDGGGALVNNHSHADKNKRHDGLISTHLTRYVMYQVEFAAINNNNDEELYDENQVLDVLTFDRDSLMLTPNVSHEVCKIPSAFGGTCRQSIPGGGDDTRVGTKSITHFDSYRNSSTEDCVNDTCNTPTPSSPLHPHSLILSFKFMCLRP